MHVKLLQSDGKFYALGSSMLGRIGEIRLLDVTGYHEPPIKPFPRSLPGMAGRASMRIHP